MTTDKAAKVIAELKVQLVLGTASAEAATAHLQFLGILKPGERMTPTGVISGSGAEPGIPRHGADENDIDHVTEAPE